MNNFFTTIKKAVIGGDYVGDFGGKRFGSAMKYLAILLLIESIVFVAALATHAAPAVKIFFEREQVTAFINSHIPEGAVVTLQDGVVSTADGLPIIIPIGEEFRQNNYDPSIRDELKGMENYVVVDPTVTENVLERFDEYNTVLLITQKEFVTLDDGSVTVTPLADFPNMEISRESALSLYEKMRPHVKTALFFVVPVGAVGVLVVSLLSYLLSTLIFALATLIVARIKQVRISYGTAYVITLYALTLPIIIDTVTDIFLHNLGFLITLVLIIVLAVFNIRRAAVSQPVVPPAPQTPPQV